MSECVVRMEMPETCFGCDMFDDEDYGRCLIRYYNGEEDYIDYRVARKARMSWCPIVCALPENHGRLVDADAFLKFMFEYDDYEGAKEAHDLDLLHRDSICYAIEEAPTIVPAEAERSET